MIRKKLIAGLSASVMAIAASATSVSAFADEVNLVQEQKELQTYVDSFAAEDESLYEIATYLSDNDFSLEETKQIMERCENSQDEMAETVNGSVSLGGSYYDVTPHEATFLRTMAADVNRDGKVDNADLVRLNKYLAGLIYPL